MKAAVEVAFSHGVASPTSIRTFGKPKELAINRGSTVKDPESDDRMDIDSSPPLPSSIEADLAEISVSNSDALLKRKKKEYKEPWVKDFPTSLLFMHTKHKPTSMNFDPFAS